jgi:L-fucose isomerase-like protein
MKAGIFFISSDLHDQHSLRERKAEVFGALQKLMPIEEVARHAFSACDLIFVAIMTGGSEKSFVEIWPDLQSSDCPFALLAFNSDNSLPAALEIKSWLATISKDGKIIHGSIADICSQAFDKFQLHQAIKRIAGETLGIIGEPSDWLIASKANLQAFKKLFGIRFNQIPMEEFNNMLEHLEVHSSTEFRDAFAEIANNMQARELDKAEKIYLALQKAVRNYCLTSLTIRCFDLLTTMTATGCLALSLLNDKGIVAGCESDVPAAVSLIVARHVSNKPAFMANPSWVKEDEAMFAHCTAPASLVQNCHAATHFESNSSLAIAGKIAAGPACLFKISADAASYALIAGELVDSELQQNLCRTQVVFKGAGIKNYLLNNPLGNHQIIIPGNHACEIKEVCNYLGLRPVE